MGTNTRLITNFPIIVIRNLSENFHFVLIKSLLYYRSVKL